MNGQNDTTISDDLPPNSPPFGAAGIAETTRNPQPSRTDAVEPRLPPPRPKPSRIGTRLVNTLRTLLTRWQPYKRRRKGKKLHSAKPSFAKRSKKQFQQVKRLKKLLQMGLEEHGLSELQACVDSKMASSSRGEAAWILVNWIMNEWPDERLPEASRYLNFIRTCPPRSAGPVARYVIETEFYLRTGDFDRAREVCMSALDKHPKSNDLKLAAHNLDLSHPRGPQSGPARNAEQQVAWLNRVLQENNLDPVQLADPTVGLTLDNLRILIDEQAYREKGPRITVIMAAHNSEQNIHTAMKSVLAQTWRNLELIVVDDASQDRTVEIVREFAQRDPRVRLMTSDVNIGPYVARNLALTHATGEIVTLHDSDDWSHPRKVERQVQPLLDNKNLMATRSDHARATSDLLFDRRGSNGAFISPNMSSLMFKRREVVREIGYWDAVRFAGDSEFLRRIQKAFGQDSVQNVPTGLVSVLRQHSASLTACKNTGYRGFKKGARWLYDQAATQWHENIANPYISHPQGVRPFPIPLPMLPLPFRSEAQKQCIHADVILASDFRMQGGTTASNIQEIKAQKRMGLRTGLLHLTRHDMNPDTPLNAKLLQLIDGEQVFWVTTGDRLDTDLVIFRYPPALQQKQNWLPQIQTKTLRIICNQAPHRGWEPDSPRVYTPETVDANASELFGVTPIWHPIGPQARGGLEAGNPKIVISEDDWVNIIDTDEWTDGRTGPVNAVPVIGRHGRDYPDKWPPDSKSILTVYPERDDLIVSILGGAAKAIERIGYTPRNWQVHPYDSIAPLDYLRKLDVFVYFPDPNQNEAFGRTIFEAMAVGVPVILPKRFRAVFGDSALYCAPHEAVELALSLFGDKRKYMEQTAKGSTGVEARFGYDQHLRRLKAT